MSGDDDDRRRKRAPAAQPSAVKLGDHGLRQRGFHPELGEEVQLALDGADEPGDQQGRRLGKPRFTRASLSSVRKRRSALLMAAQRRLSLPSGKLNLARAIASLTAPFISSKARPSSSFLSRASRSLSKASSHDSWSARLFAIAHICSAARPDQKWLRFPSNRRLDTRRTP